MKKIVLPVLPVFFLFIVSFSACSAKNSDADKQKDVVKILSYNVRNCRGMDNIISYQRIANVINRIAPEVVALQELDSATQRSNGIVVLDQLASLTSMYKIYGASIDYQGGKYGIGILSKEKPISWKVVALPGREERRSLLIVELNDYFICCTHFSLTEEDRIASVDIINNSLKNFSKPIFLAGDFNADPESQVIKSIENKWYVLNDPLQPTIPASSPSRCIDFIFASNYNGYTFETIKTVVEQEYVASDHLPVWVEVKIK
jgi:endonuclease/exonuclease/phosphatase family metal-dependent hydrolase